MVLLEMAPAFAQSDNPFIKNYPRTTYYSSEFTTAPQIWSFAQRTDGVMFLANTNGVLEFDGKSWRMTPGTEGLPNLRVHSGPPNRIYVSAQTDFGYLAPDAAGNLHFKSIYIGSEPPEVRSIWDARDGVWFVATHRLWRWDPQREALESWQAPGPILNAFIQGGALWCRIEGKGIARAGEANWQFEPGSQVNFPSRVQVILSLNPASPSLSDLLFVTRSDGQHLWNKGQLTRWSTGLDPNLQVWDATPIHPERIALATHTQGLIVLDRSGRVLNTYNREGGLISNTLITAFQDRQSGIWVSSDFGVSRIEYPPRLQFFGYNSFLEGAVTAVARQNDDLWVGTTNGLFYTSILSRDAYLFFTKENITTDEVWAVLAREDEVWIGTTRGLFLKKGKGPFRPLTTRTTRSLLASRVQEGVVFLGLEDGVGVIRKEGGEWKIAGSLKGITHRVESMAEDEQGRLWAGHREVSVARFRGGFSLEPQVEKMGPAQGFTEDLDILEPAWIDGKIRVGTYNGLRVFDPQKNLLIPDLDVPAALTDGSVSAYVLKYDALGRFWVSLGEEKGWLEKTPNGRVWRHAALNPVSSEVISFYPDPKGVMWIGALEGLYRFLPDEPGPENPSAQALVRKVTTVGENVVFGGNGLSGNGITLTYQNNDLRFECASSVQAFPEQVSYRFRLAGFDADWSEWGFSEKKEYTGLFEGTYTFEVQVRDVYGNESPAASFTFKLLPPWYRSWLAYGVYAALLMLLGAGVISLILKRQRAKLSAKEAELDLERQTGERLRQVDRLKDEFLANTSHELRTPLHGIIGLSESLIERVTDADQREDLAMIISSGKRLSSLVNDLLDFSKLKNHEIELRLKPVDLHSLCNVVIHVHQTLVEGKPVALRNEISADFGPALADEDRVQQILFNLVGNAVKFTESGAITLRATVEQNQVQVCVTDTGTGIPADKIEVIFQEFQQGDGSVSRRFAGTGLGLSISKKLVELHGGTMWVESEPGVGSSFYFTLPAASPTGLADTPRTTTASRKKSDAVRLPKFEPAAFMPDQVRILVVDDEPINHQVLRNHLSAPGFYLTHAMSGTEALALLDNGQTFDLVLLDVMMPRMSGYEVCRQIRERFLPSELPIIMVTAKNQVQDLVEGLNTGANDYIAKPFSKDEFLARVNTHLSLYRIHQVMGKFVPQEFIRSLGKDSITEVALGDQVEREVTVMFTDIRNYTGMAETMTPEDNFRFVNAFHGRLGPIVSRNKGFIVQFLGDGFMAIFPDGAASALRASVEMQQSVEVYNEMRQQKGRVPISLGLGMHTGLLIMGIIGDDRRMDAATISDAVNTASRMEGLTKFFGAPTLFSEATFLRTPRQDLPNYRFLGKVQVKGKQEPIRIFECLDGLPSDRRVLVLRSKPHFERGLDHFYAREFSAAADEFTHALAIDPTDKPSQMFLHRATRYLLESLPNDWTGVEVISEK
jgi:signal transduction histidine kinase/DNA-binding response OmpR family regulator/ligand-binding sensor domain-containing protein